MTFGNALQASPPGAQASSPGAPVGVSGPQDAAFDVEEFVADARSAWFLDKITSFFSSDPPVAPNTALQNAMDEFAVAIQAGLQAAEDIGQASAIAATITGSIYNFQTGQSKGTQAAGILGNISNTIAPFMTDEIGESTEGVSWGIKLVVDAAGNLGAAGAS